MAPLPQPLWTALPCTFISILVTIVLTKATTSTKDKGLTTVLKAMCVFLLVLALMSAIVNIFLVSIVEDPGPSIENLSPLVNDLQDVERRDFDAQFEISNDDQVAEWRGGVQGDTDLVVGKKGEEKRDGKKKLIKKVDEKTREKQIRKMLIKEFWPKRNTLLGGKKGEVAEVEKGHV